MRDSLNIRLRSVQRTKAATRLILKLQSTSTTSTKHQQRLFLLQKHSPATMQMLALWWLTLQWLMLTKKTRTHLNYRVSALRALKWLMVKWWLQKAQISTSSKPRHSTSRLQQPIQVVFLFLLRLKSPFKISMKHPL